MADEDKKEYKGTGKFNSLIGRATVENAILAAIGSAIGLLLMRKDPMKGAWIGGGVGGVVGAVHGGYKGYQSAAQGKEQFDATQAELDSTRAQLEQQKGFVARLTDDRNASKTPARGA